MAGGSSTARDSQDDCRPELRSDDEPFHRGTSTFQADPPPRECARTHTEPLCRHEDGQERGPSRIPPCASYRPPFQLLFSSRRLASAFTTRGRLQLFGASTGANIFRSTRGTAEVAARRPEDMLTLPASTAPHRATITTGCDSTTEVGIRLNGDVPSLRGRRLRDASRLRPSRSRGSRRDRRGGSGRRRSARRRLACTAGSSTDRPGAAERTANAICSRPASLVRKPALGLRVAQRAPGSRFCT